MAISYYKVKFEMRDSRVLECRFGFATTPATYWDPGDCEVGDPEYLIDGEEVSYDDLPHGLDIIANEMYEDFENAKFKVEVSHDDGYDYEP